MKKVKTVENVLDERNSVHGAFIDNSRISQALKLIVRCGKNWNCMEVDERQCLDAICDKISRLLSGQHDYPDHWCDIAGYATLVYRRICNDRNRLKTR